MFPRVEGEFQCNIRVISSLVIGICVLYVVISKTEQMIYEDSRAGLNMTDLLLINGDVLTMDPENPRGQWVAVEEGKILAVGSGNAPGEYQTPPTRVIDLAGKTVLPGFIDAHLHFRALAESLATIPLGPRSGVTSICDIVDRIHDEAKDLPPGSWI